MTERLPDDYQPVHTAESALELVTHWDSGLYNSGPDMRRYARSLAHDVAHYAGQATRARRELAEARAEIERLRAAFVDPDLIAGPRSPPSFDGH